MAFPKLSWICDKKVADGCSLRRPDLTLDLGSHVLFIEVEENGHDFGYTCTSKRLCELFKDVGERNCHFLRFNPDGYTDASGKKVPSCWKKTKVGLSVVKDEKAWSLRKQALADAIQRAIDTVTSKMITIENLFFDEVTPTSEDEHEKEVKEQLEEEVEEEVEEEEEEEQEVEQEVEERANKKANMRIA